MVKITNSDFSLIALACNEDHLKTAWLLNNHLHISLTIAENDSHFAIYYENSYNLPICLIQNKKNNKIFLNSLKHFDYVLKIISTDKKAIKTIKDKIVKINNINLATIIDKNKLTKKDLKNLQKIFNI